MFATCHTATGKGGKGERERKGKSGCEGRGAGYVRREREKALRKERLGKKSKGGETGRGRVGET